MFVRVRSLVRLRSAIRRLAPSEASNMNKNLVEEQISPGLHEVKHCTTRMSTLVDDSCILRRVQDLGGGIVHKNNHEQAAYLEEGMYVQRASSSSITIGSWISKRKPRLSVAPRGGRGRGHAGGERNSVVPFQETKQ